MCCTGLPTLLSCTWLVVLAESCMVHSFIDDIKNKVLVQVQEKPEHQYVHCICVLGTVASSEICFEM